MNDCGGTDQTVDEAILIYEVSDHAIENAAGSIQEKAGAFTLSFCSGLDTCPTVEAANLADPTRATRNS